MVAARRLTVLAVFGVLAAALAGPAAARPNPALYPETLTTPHFAIHFTGELDPNTPNPDRITFQIAGDLAANAERAYSTLVTDWGYPAPLNDGDGLIDIWVQDLGGDMLGFASLDAPGNTGTGWIAMEVTAATSLQVIAHELMHLIQYSQWITADAWLLEGTAEWAGFSISGYSPFSGTVPDSVGAPDMSLDCDSDACGNDLYETGGYSRWPFFEYLTDRFGVGAVKDVFARGASLADPLQTGATLLDGTLATKGTTLGTVFGDYALASLTGSVDAPGLAGLAPATHATVSTGVVSAALPVQTVPVNHLAARYLKLTRGASTSGVCFEATLNLTVALPAGSAARPGFYSRSLGSSAIPLAVNGSTATLSVPWDTCFGNHEGYLVLPNPSLTADAQQFVVSGSLSVDLTKIPTPKGPPDPLWTGPTVASPSGEVAPSIFVYGAQLLRVSASTRVVRLIVFSSGQGKLEATLGNAKLGAFRLRAGNNDVRFRLPVSALLTLRAPASTRAASSVLRLTSFSTEGTKGKTVTRKVALMLAKRR
jgi:hypothetical protein